jgi:hypothetical protein
MGQLVISPARQTQANSQTVKEQIIRQTDRQTDSHFVTQTNRMTYIENVVIQEDKYQSVESLFFIKIFLKLKIHFDF